MHNHNISTGSSQGKGMAGDRNPPRGARNPIRTDRQFVHTLHYVIE